MRHATRRGAPRSVRQATVAGFDPANGDWQYGMFERMDDGGFGGTWIEVGSDLHAMCVTCHTGAADNDYAFLTYTGH